VQYEAALNCVSEDCSVMKSFWGVCVYKDQSIGAMVT
jgi:hypothetical protein